MIGHQQEQMRIPFLSILVKSRGLKEDRRDLRLAKLIVASLLAADRDEKDGIGRADEMRRFMWQRTAADGLRWGTEFLREGTILRTVRLILGRPIQKPNINASRKIIAMFESPFVRR